MKTKKAKQDYTQLLSIATDLASAINNAYWKGPLHGPTSHMSQAVYDLELWMIVNKVSTLNYKRVNL